MSPASRRQQRITFAVLAVAVGAFALLQSLIIPVLSRIQTEYDTDQATVTWVLTAYLLSASVATPLLGRLGDALGKKRVLVGALAALTLGSLLAGIAPSIEWLIFARVVQGAGGGVIPLAFGIIRDEFTETMTNALAVLASLTASITESGRLLLPSAVASFLVGFFTARLMGRYGARSVILAGALISAASYTSLALLHGTTELLFIGITAQGLGTGLVISSSASVVIASVPAHQTGVASGMNANIRTIGGSIGSAVMAGLVTAHTGVGGLPLERGYTVGFLVLAGCLLVASVAALGIPDIHRTERAAPELQPAEVVPR